MGLIERVFGRPAASKTASAAFLLKGLARPSGGPAQRNPGLAAPWDSGGKIALRGVGNGEDPLPERAPDLGAVGG